MSQITKHTSETLQDEIIEWQLNAGEQQIVAKRMPGRYRRLKWFGMSVWLIYFLGPYLRWQGQQAVLLDIPNRQFHIFSMTLYPQDIWMLSLTLLFFAILLAVVSAVAGRVFCGYFCFQTVWTDIYTLIEEWLEGNTPQKQQKFRQEPFSLNKLSRRLTKHSLWMLIALLTGITFSAWFTDAYQLWRDVFALQAHIAVWIALAVFTVFTYGFAGFMREQVCFWLCPYARLQSVMYDQDTVLPAYDVERGEPRGKLQRGQLASGQGSCIDCKLCVAVCPTGIDIRKGQQEGCITCGLCIDACDSVMDKIEQPRGLIRYASHAELVDHQKPQALLLRPRVLVYCTIMLVSLVGVVYGFATLSPTAFTALPERQPLYVQLSDGSIQNRYTLKLLNKQNQPMEVQYRLEAPTGFTLHGLHDSYHIEPGQMLQVMALVRREANMDADGITSLRFVADVINDASIDIYHDSVFIGPETGN
ncbi:cytochrome c oxidase accessory protein CcoG [Methylophaga lonarensis]|uniref:cytochrome c oxidase accessory protein CcoG n=1 Tax=Methylophaga lonarensis TaxID=999151 RepID=UPI003D28DB85